MERLLIKGKKPEQVEEVDGDDFRYYLLAGMRNQREFKTPLLKLNRQIMSFDSRNYPSIP